MKSIWLINLTKNIHPFLGGVIFTLYFSLLIGFALAVSSIFIEVLGTPINWIASVVVIMFSFYFVAMSYIETKKQNLALHWVLNIRTLWGSDPQPNPVDIKILQERDGEIPTLEKIFKYRIGLHLVQFLILFIFIFASVFWMAMIRFVFFEAIILNII